MGVQIVYPSTSSNTPIAYASPSWSAEKPKSWKVLDHRHFSLITRKCMYPFPDILEFWEQRIARTIEHIFTVYEGLHRVRAEASAETPNLIIPATIGKPADEDDDAQKAYECYPKQHLCALAADARAITEQYELRRWYLKGCRVAENAPH